MTDITNNTIIYLASNDPTDANNKPNRFRCRLTSPLVFNDYTEWEVALLDYMSSGSMAEGMPENKTVLFPLHLKPTSYETLIDSIGTGNPKTLSWGIKKSDIGNSGLIEKDGNYLMTFSNNNPHSSLTVELDKAFAEILSLCPVKKSKAGKCAAVTPVTQKFTIEKSTNSHFLCHFQSLILSEKDVKDYVQDTTLIIRAEFKDAVYQHDRRSILLEEERFHYIYTSITRHVDVGYTKVPLLRIVDLGKESQGGGNFQPIYTPLAKSSIDDISIRICDKRGKSIQYQDHGQTQLILQFRRKQV